MWAFWKLFVFISMFGAVVHADDDDDDESPEAIIKEMDMDKDGKLSIEELLVQVTEDMSITKDTITKLFKESDKNGDGLIDIDELPDLKTAVEKEEGTEL